jgi:hypothetical protein
VSEDVSEYERFLSSYDPATRTFCPEPDPESAGNLETDTQAYRSAYTRDHPFWGYE